MRLVLRPVQTSFSYSKRAVQDYFDEKGGLLLAKGQAPRKLTKDLNSRLVYSLHYEWSETSDTDILDTSCPKDRIISDRICPWIHPIYLKAGLLDPSLLKRGILFIDNLLQELETHRVIAEDFESLKKHDNYTYMHSVNVALLAYALGTVLKYEGEKLRRLVLGALLHDIGKLTIPVSIINKPVPLSDAEYTLIQHHSTRGFQRSSEFFLPRSVLAVILEHHERWNGSGYPRGLCKNNIHPYAQIVAVADVLDALIADRPYRPGLPPYHAIEMILKLSGTEFSPEVIKALLNAIKLYPENSLVTLNSGESGIVISFSYPQPTRPVIRILFDANGNPVSSEQIIDLCNDSQHYIDTVNYDWVS
jgi:putative nucleotidyltransferase with HDIG domain